MDSRSTLDWLNGILPAPLSVGRGGGFTVGVGAGGGRVFACTTDFARVETGLAVTADEVLDMRCELIALRGGALADAASGLPADAAGRRHAASPSGQDPRETVVRVAGTAAAWLAADGGVPQPGTVLEGLGRSAGLDPATVSVRHGLLVPPTVWGGSVPQVTEAPDNVGGQGVEPGRGRLTALLQVLMLTDAEFGVLAAHGPEGLLAALTASGVDTADWARPDTVGAAR